MAAIPRAMLPEIGSRAPPKPDGATAENPKNVYVAPFIVDGADPALTERANAIRLGAIEILRSFPEVRYTVSTINTGAALGKMYASVYVRLVDRKNRQRSVDEMSIALRQRLAQVPGITVTHTGLLDSVGGQKQITFSIQGPDNAELNRILADTTGKPIDKVTRDTERDHYMSAEEACAYGIVDKVVTKPVAEK